jgi:pyruvate/2-oxoglutarate dehydrogenase complex dihydrolipoamide acyltransferase (E2) component
MQEKTKFTLSNVPRCRWNVLDLLTIFGRGAARGYLFLDVDMTEAEQFRAKLSQRGDRITVTAILLKAIATAQRLYPQSMQGYMPLNLRLNIHEIAGGFTVERMIDDKPAVFFGVIDKPQEKEITQIAAELREFGASEIAQQPKLQMQDSFAKVPAWIRRIVFNLGLILPQLRLAVNHATFGLSTLGKYGVVTAFGPCVCACTFGVGTVEDRPVVRDGQVTIRPMVTIALSFDQRILDTAPAAMFMRDVKELIEGKLEDYTLVESSSSLGLA